MSIRWVVWSVVPRTGIGEVQGDKLGEVTAPSKAAAEREAAKRWPHQRRAVQSAIAAKFDAEEEEARRRAQNTF